MARNASTQRGFDSAFVERVLDALPATRTTSVIGLSGLQGSGKSTLAAQLIAQAARRGVYALRLSLDDFYLGRRARFALARNVHPLLATRGVPGTHDVALLRHTLDALARASDRRPVALPRFDKGRDTRVAPSRWRIVRAPPVLIMLEGWCVGIPAQSERALRAPINELERDEDVDGRWRRFVNASLATDYAALWSRLGALVWLQAPSFDIVARWRDEQERALRLRGARHAMTRVALHRFVMHYERLSRHSLRALPARADARVALDDNRRPVQIVEKVRR